MLENVIDVTENCRHSLMCRHVCPVGNLTRLETLTPHGWAQLVALERRGLSAWTPETVEALYACADCGSCRAHCVSSQPLPAGIAAARAVVVERDLAPPAVYALAERLEEWENPYAEQAPTPAEGTGEDALFVGDARHLRPAALEAALTLLRAAGVDPVLIGDGRSSGYLASSVGVPDVAKRLAQATLDELEAAGARRLFVLDPGDFFAFFQMHDERLGVPLPDGVEIREVIPFLAERLADGDLAFRPLAGPAGDGAATYAYVDPTHAVRVQSRFGTARKLLEAVLPTPARELFWRGSRAYPCGDLALAFTQPGLADALTQARLEDAADVGATVVITEAPGGLAHLERHADAHGLCVQGLYELLADRLDA